MAEYIEREAVCYQLAKQATIDGQPRAIRRAAKIVADFPAADVQPARHGRWIETKTGFHCSDCKGKAEGTKKGALLSPYCPECGAIMDKEDTNAEKSD